MVITQSSSLNILAVHRLAATRLPWNCNPQHEEAQNQSLVHCTWFSFEPDQEYEPVMFDARKHIIIEERLTNRTCMNVLSSTTQNRLSIVAFIFEAES